MTSFRLLQDLLQSVLRNGIFTTVQILISTLKDRKFDPQYEIQTQTWKNSAISLYGATRAQPFRQCLRRLPLNKDFLFMDLGAGLGRAMILAAEHGFHEVHGIEYDPELQQQGAQNLKQVQKSFPNTHFSIQQMDMKTLALPESPCCFYSYDPGIENVTEIFKKIRTRAHPTILIFHHNLLTPKQAHELGPWTQILRSEGSRFYIWKN